MVKLRPDGIDAADIVPVVENILVENDASYAPLPLMELILYTIRTSTALFAYVILGQGVTDNYVPFVGPTEARLKVVKAMD